MDGKAAGSSLEQFLLLAQSARGAAAVQLVRQATEAPGVYVYGELLECPNIQDLENTAHSSHLALLNMFAYGNYKSLVQSPLGAMPEVSEAMRTKLRLLTVVSLAERNKLLPYRQLMQELEIDTVRELEDLVIDGISSGAVGGKLDQVGQHFEVDYVTGRDTTKMELGAVVGVLAAWCENCDNVLNVIEKQVEKVNSEMEDKKCHKAALEKKMEEVKEKNKTRGGGEEGDEDIDSRMDTDRGEKRERKGGKSKSSRKGGPGGGGWWK